MPQEQPNINSHNSQMVGSQQQQGQAAHQNTQSNEYHDTQSYIGQDLRTGFVRIFYFGLFEL